MDDDDLQLFRRTVVDALATRWGTQVDDVVERLGWRDALDTDRQAAVAVLFECLGSSHASCTSLDDVLAGSLSPAGSPTAAVVLPKPDGTQPPGEVRGDRLHVRGVASARLAETGRALIVAGSPEGPVTAWLKAADLEVRSIGGMDPELGLVEVAGTLPTPLDVDASAPGLWAAAVRTGQLALAHQLLGAAGAMLELARQHAGERMQFGSPIGSFQGVSHRLAETLVAAEGARAALTVAWDDPEPSAGSVAKALAGRAALLAARHGQQVLAGIGFTTEHRFHHYVRRALVLDQLLGSARRLTSDLGRRLIEERRLPVSPPL
jgi:hypothetical protein